MSAGVLVSWALCGLVVGLAARFLVPGRQHMGLLKTVGLGIVGAFVGGFLYWFMAGPTGEPFSLADNVWHGWLVSIIGAAVVLWGYAAFFPRRWWQ